MRPLDSDQTGRRSRSAVRKPVRALVVLFAMVASILPWSGAAQAHGTIINPQTRAYQCWKTWGSQHMNPAMQTQDPMCYQAFQANPDTMWNWMSALRDGLGGQFQARTPDGTLCSNNLSRNNSLNNLGAWKSTPITRNFTVQLYDQASHGADYFRVYVSKQGFNPQTQRLGWGNLDFITQTGRYAPSQNISFNVNTSGYTGNHILFIIWQASHLDQAYMWCSDVRFCLSTGTNPAPGRRSGAGPPPNDEVRSDHEFPGSFRGVVPQPLRVGGGDSGGDGRRRRPGQHGRF